jgi:serine/threonine protein kinase
VTEIGVGSVLGGYRIDGVIGHGGMGVVYRATQLRLQRTVALKVIMPALASDLSFRERFERESRLAASIDHNHVVPVYEADEVDGLLYIAMRYVDGKDLRALIESEGPLDPARVARLIAHVSSALDAAHARGLVHRDVKPGNILVAGRGAEEHAYLTDFGLTKSVSEAGLTKTGQWVGTLDYAAPEQINNGPVDARTDVYALGCVLYQALTGQVPYVRDSDVAKMYAHLHDPAPMVAEVRPEVPDALGHVVTRAMEKDPGQRFPSAGDLGRGAVAAAAGSAHPPPERSVATGDAAPPTVAAPGPTAPASQPHTPTPQPQPQPRTPTPPTHAAPVFAQTPPPAAAPASSNRGLLIAAVALLVVIVAGGAAFAAGVFDSGDGDGGGSRLASSTATATETAAETATESATEEPTSEPTATSTPLRNQSGAPSYFTYYGPAFQAQLPEGRGWGAPAQSEPTPGELYRTSVRGPDGQFVIIDYTPYETAKFGGDYFEKTRVGQTAFGSATRYVFQGGTLPECQRYACVDYLINDPATGSGFGVLAGGPDFDAASSVAQTVAESVVPS